MNMSDPMLYELQAWINIETNEYTTSELTLENLY